jgi:hypothetical protein
MRSLSLVGMMMGCGLYANVAMAEFAAVPVSAQDLFVPQGFDDNDQVTVVLDGYFPNSCYRVDRVEKNIDNESKIITIEQFARVYPGPCLMLLVPFTSEVNLGTVPSGDYKVVTNRGNLNHDLNVAVSTNEGPDDFLYAPVDQARVEKTREGLLYAVLGGRFTSTCMELRDVKVIYSGSTIEVLPLMEVPERDNCERQEVPFQRLQPLSALQPGRYLLHVRSLNGHATNVVFQVFQKGDPIL